MQLPIVAPVLPAANPRGRPEEYPKWDIVKGILSSLRTGGVTPPSWGIVYPSC